MSHTPGPWSFDGDYVESLALLKPLSVATLADCGHSTEGNGILIAAAPELLSQLKVAAAFISGHNECLSVPSGSGDRQWNDYCVGLLEDCKAAIEKAEGRSE